MQVHWNNSLDMSPHSDNQSLLFLRNAACEAEKQQIQIS